MKKQTQRRKRKGRKVGEWEEGPDEKIHNFKYNENLEQINTYLSNNLFKRDKDMKVQERKIIIIRKKQNGKEEENVVLPLIW